MLNFIGTVHELKPDCVTDSAKHPKSNHIAPSLIMSGTLSKSTKRIQDSFERRYFINIIDNLFEDMSVQSFLASSQLAKIATLGKKRVTRFVDSKTTV